MTAIRKHYSPACKAQVVQEVLAGERTLAQIAAHHGVHPNLISTWKRAALHAMPSAFTDNAPLEAQIAALKAEHEREKEQLYARGASWDRRLSGVLSPAAAPSIPGLPNAC